MIKNRAGWNFTIFHAMPAQKKRQGRHCALHPKTIAVARCSVCKSWVCGQCGKKVAHHWYCPSCSEKKQIFYTPETASRRQPPTPETQPRALSLPSLMLLSGVTLGLCGLVFGLWNMRTAHDLSLQNDELREKRSELVGQIKERNREIAELNLLSDSLQTLLKSAALIKKSSGRPVSPTETPALPENGLPISFDNGTALKKCVALTFDGGDRANAAPDILDTLKSRDVKATMFLTGRFMLKEQDVVRRIIGDGHEVGNHTYSHPHLTSFAQDRTQNTLPSVTEAVLVRELLLTDSLFSAIYGVKLSPLWRSPYGDHNRTICVWGQRAGFLHIGWGQGRTWRRNLDSNDWTPNEETSGYHTPQEVYDKIMELASEPEGGINGGIILMHLGTVRPQREKQVHLILGKLIDSLRSLGYRMVIVSELLRESDVDISPLVKNK
jgi:peptidoglycan/xylan/chitin deacetylase (PgdA/CDA1 family)